MIKAIFFDIDGTLLSYKTHRVLPGTVKAFDALRARGIKTVISSGRPTILIPDMPIHFDGFITVNGGLCYAGDKVLLRNTIDDGDSRRWIDYVEQNGLTTMCFTENEMYINRIAPEAVALRDQLGFTMPPVLPLNELRGQSVYQFIALQPADKDAEVLQTLSHCRMPRWHPAFSDIIPQNSSKAVGIERMLDHFGIARDEAMAFGDGANDIEMLEYVGTGIAMGNAADIVKQHAKYTTDSADDEGIFNALKKMRII